MLLRVNNQCHTWETLEKDHGRIEKRIYTTLKASEVFNEGEYSDWQGLQTLVQVERIVSRLEGETRQEKQYYISSLAPELCKELGQYIRGHWSIENRLHWHLDVSFREDACRARKDYSATNLNTLQKFALAIVSQHKDKLSLRKRLFKAALNINLPQKATKDLMRLPWCISFVDMHSKDLLIFVEPRKGGVSKYLCLLSSYSISINLTNK